MFSTGKAEERMAVRILGAYIIHLDDVCTRSPSECHVNAVASASTTPRLRKSTQKLERYILSSAGPPSTAAPASSQDGAPHGSVRDDCREAAESRLTHKPFRPSHRPRPAVLVLGTGQLDDKSWIPMGICLVVLQDKQHEAKLR